MSTTTKPNIISSLKPTTNKDNNNVVGCVVENLNKAECFWSDMSDHTTEYNPIIGYRTIISSDNGFRNISIVKANIRNIILKNLKPDSEYTFKVQAITTHGIGTTELLHRFKHLKNNPKNKEIESEIHFGNSPLEGSNKAIKIFNFDLFKLFLRIILFWISLKYLL